MEDRKFYHYSCDKRQKCDPTYLVCHVLLPRLFARIVTARGRIFNHVHGVDIVDRNTLAKLLKNIAKSIRPRYTEELP